MKQIAVAAFALVLGLVLGGLAPRSDVRELEQRLAEVESQGPCRSTVGSDLAALMGSGTRNRARAERNPLGDRDPVALAEENPEAAELAEQMNDEQERIGDELTDEISDGINEEELELARTALELRRAQSRAALMEDARPDETQMETIDTAVKDMNDSLLGLADEMVVMLESGDDPTRRDAMEFVAEALDTMLMAEDAMRSALDADQVGQLDEAALDPFSYVAPELVDLLSGLGDE